MHSTVNHYTCTSMQSMSADAEEGAGGSLSSRLLAQVPKYYLHARVPALKGLVRQPWEALVIDHPGFLDTIPRIAEIPLKALSVSSVVVLVIHGFQITAKMNMDCYKQAFEKDPGKAYTYLPTIPVFQDYPEFSASFPAVLLDS